ncbi:MAG TPA: EamA family transporter, partial [Methanocorpusculum sp.]|nr:EamA family transporter [Methanocorpusculum sp.]
MNWAFGKYVSSLLLFGSNGIVASMILLSSYDIVFLRTLIGSLFLLAVFLIGRHRFSFFRNKKSAVFLAASGA